MKEEGYAHRKCETSRTESNSSFFIVFNLSALKLSVGVEPLLNHRPLGIHKKCFELNK